MENLILIFGVAAVIVLLCFGGTAIIANFAHDSGKTVSDVFAKSNERCDACLEQFDPEVHCRFDSTSKVCVELQKYSCVTNCTITLT